MKIENGSESLKWLVIKQLENLFYIDQNEINTINLILKNVLIRTEKCFKKTPNKYYHKDKRVYFNPYHSGQYNIFLYFLSNTIFKETKNTVLADKIYYLNKIFNACDIFYEVELPEVFMLDHPVGAVMGRAKYGNYFNFSHGCTVGGNNDLYPIIGENVTMMSDSKIVGKSVIGNNVIIAANTYIKDEKIPNNQIVFGASPNLILKENKFKI
jgi:serine O-acetyltransferase